MKRWEQLTITKCAALLRKLQPSGTSPLPPDHRSMPAGTPDGWWAFQCLQLEPQWESVSLGLYIELPRESEWRRERQDPSHWSSQRPNCLNTLKTTGCLLYPSVAVLRPLSPDGGVSCCGGVRASKYSRSWALCPEDFKSSFSSKSTSATWTAWQRSRSIRKRKAMAASNCAVRNSTWK